MSLSKLIYVACLLIKKVVPHRINNIVKVIGSLMK